jgi:putative hydrolase of the HAD superfamily
MMEATMIRAVTFDFWDTLYGSLGAEGVVAGRTDALRRYLLSKGHNFAEDAVRRAYHHAEERLDYHARTDWLCPGPELAMSDIFGSLGLTPTQHETEALLEQFRTNETTRITPLPGVPETLAAMSTDFRIGLISDTWLTPGKLLRERMEQHGLKRFFSAMVFSDETGFRKPHAHQFELALSALGVRPAECVHVGDIESTDIRGAKASGMKAILFDAEHAGRPTEADIAVRAFCEVRPAVLRLNRPGGKG